MVGTSTLPYYPVFHYINIEALEVPENHFAKYFVEVP